MEEYDIAVIGCGPAGLSASIFTGRANLRTIVIGVPERSQMTMAMNIENYFGFPEGIDGPVLLNKGIIQAQKFGVKFCKEEVVAIDVKDENEIKVFTLKTSSGKLFSAHSIIIATGVPIRMSGIKDEQKFSGKGLHYCVNCDGPMYKNKRLAIIGNGDHAAESAMEALSYTKDITIVANDSKFSFSDESDREITKWNIKTVLGKVKEFRGEKFLESVIMEDGRELRFDGVFMACGAAGALDFAANLGLEIQDGMLVVDENNKTSMDGVFAAGNCEGRCRQIAKNVGDGCNAAINAIKYLRQGKLYFDYVHSVAKIAEDSKKATEVKDPDKISEDTQETAKIDQAATLGEHASEETKSSIIIRKSVNSTGNPFTATKRKLRVGWFSFSCCEDSTIIFTEILNDYYDRLKDVIDIVHARVLKKNNDLRDLDIAFVEGAIASPKAEEELKKIRKNSKKLIAIGACAVTGMPSGQRNDFDERRKREIAPILSRPGYRKEVVPLHEIVKVDDSVPGCPMLEASFINVLNKSLKEFGVDAQL